MHWLLNAYHEFCLQLLFYFFLYIIRERWWNSPLYIRNRSIKGHFVDLLCFFQQKGNMTKKDRCLFLFNDMLACATVKRKANALRRGSLSM